MRPCLLVLQKAQHQRKNRNVPFVLELNLKKKEKGPFNLLRVGILDTKNVWKAGLHRVI